MYRVLLGLVGIGLMASAAPAVPTTQEAIKSGGEYLRKAWSGPSAGTINTHQVGGAALAGMAMLEAGVKPDDEAIRNVAKIVRGQALAQTQTYHVALAILFLDKLADKNDIPIIQMLGVRLYAGMNSGGGWTYSTWDGLNDGEIQRLTRVLSSAPEGVPAPGPKKPPEPIDPFKNPGAGKPEPANTDKLHPEVARLYLLVRQTLQARGRGAPGGDNSNTQFGTIGLWVAMRNGLPAADAFALIEARFLQTQNPRDGGWAYAAETGSSTVAMTCAGLIGLAVGGASRDKILVSEPKKVTIPQGKEGDPFFNPQKTDGSPAPTVGTPAKAAGTVRERSVAAGLNAIGRVLAATAIGGPGQNNGLDQFIGLGNTYYMLWSVERMAVAYDLETIGEVDWYAWGCNYLLSRQGPDGSWGGESYGSDVNTSFALLFLTKANSVRDLTNKIKGKIKDPGKAELRGGGAAPPLHAPPPPENERPPMGGSKPETAPDAAIPERGFTLPEIVPRQTSNAAEEVAKTLTLASDENWISKLEEVRDAKGAQYTRGLMLAAGRLDGLRRIEARDALAERLVRMTPGTLRLMMRDTDAELRRAAVLACGMRDELQFAPDLIDRLTDNSDLVVRAARASLKSLTNTDFGPVANADDDAKLEAANAWRAWLAKNRQQK